MTPKRWEIVRAMTGAGPLGIRAIARRVERDVKSVHGDVQALLKAGVLDRDEEGKSFSPMTKFMWISLCVRRDGARCPL